MQNYRESGQASFDILKNVKSELRLRAGFELICAVRGADSYCERIAACALNKFLHILGTGVGRVLSFYVDLVLYPRESTELSLNDNAVIVSVLNDLAGKRDIIFEWLG